MVSNFDSSVNPCYKNKCAYVASVERCSEVGETDGSSESSVEARQFNVDVFQSQSAGVFNVAKVVRDSLPKLVLFPRFQRSRAGPSRREGKLFQLGPNQLCVDAGLFADRIAQTIGHGRVGGGRQWRSGRNRRNKAMRVQRCRRYSILSNRRSFHLI